jgi:hypothetical protein
LTSVLLNQLPLPDLPETLITSLVFLPRVHPITKYRRGEVEFSGMFMYFCRWA